MGEQIERLAQFVAETRWEDIPDAVQQHAKLVLLDTLGVILAGAEQPEVGQLRERLLATTGTGATVLARGWPTSDPRTAALLNGIAGRSIELCEGHRYVSCQGAVQIVPGVLAVGEWAQCSGREMLTALILGYDVAVRLGAALTARPLAHQNGQAPLLGAVAAGARLRGLNAAETSRALRIGATLVLTPSYTNAVAGATTLNVAGGMSGFAARWLLIWPWLASRRKTMPWRKHWAVWWATAFGPKASWRNSARAGRSAATISVCGLLQSHLRRARCPRRGAGEAASGA